MRTRSQHKEIFAPLRPSSCEDGSQAARSRRSGASHREGARHACALQGYRLLNVTYPYPCYHMLALGGPARWSWNKLCVLHFRRMKLTRPELYSLNNVHGSGVLLLFAFSAFCEQLRSGTTQDPAVRIPLMRPRASWTDLIRMKASSQVPRV